MKYEIDQLRAMAPSELIDVLLEVEDRQSFWLMLGMLCAVLPRDRRQEMQALWATAYVQPEADYPRAASLLREMKASLPDRKGH